MGYMVCLIPLFFIVATLYSSVGFGGASSYLAVMSLFSFSYYLMPKVSLLCNIVVVLGASLIYYRSGHLNILKSMPFLIGSLPMAYVGGNINVGKNEFYCFLSIALIIASFSLFYYNTENINRLKNMRNTVFPSIGNTLSFLTKVTAINVLIGATIGLISGCIGIGGGVLLAPILYLSGWGFPKQISATACFFILINSISALCGQFTKDINFEELQIIVLLAMAVFIGGQVGTRYSIFKMSEQIVKRLTAIIIFTAGVRALMQIL